MISVIFSKVSPVFLLGHACFDLWYSPRYVIAQILIASLSDQDAVFNPHTAHFTLVLPDLLSVEVAEIEFVKFFWDVAVE